MKSFHWIFLGASLGLLAVAVGAFGDHLLKDRLVEWYGERGPRQMENWQTGSRYLMYHALVLLALGCLPPKLSRRGVSLAGACFLAGCLLFSGGLFASVLSGTSWLVHIVPVGGMALLAGWLILAATAWAGRRDSSP